ncbi:MFS transporter [Corynebacterium sp. H128]|uniref:MFS transporter n=1 Tax=Corynebacterium sp. H128 TaxID=3133427 RepID=UPI0030A3BC39
MDSLKLTPVIGVGLMFASNGALFASLLPWYPTLMREWGLSEATFGLTVACFALGSILSSAVPAPVVKRFGPQNTVIGATAVMAALLSLGGTLSSGLMLAVLLLALGFVDPIVDVAQNVAAVKVQDKVGFSIMSSVHAMWSLGAALGGAAATLAVGEVAMMHHLLLAAVVAVVMATVGARMTGALPADVAEEKAGKPRNLQTLWLVLPIVVVAMSGTIVEEVANSWAPLIAHQLAGVPVADAGIALTLMLSAQCIGRFAGDPMINRWGRVRIAQFGGALITVGAVLAIFSQGTALLYLGLGLAGFGCATIVPSAFAAGAALPGVSAGAGLTLVSWLMRISFLTASPIIGAIASVSSLRVALSLLVLGGVTIVLLGHKLNPRSVVTIEK